MGSGGRRHRGTSSLGCSAGREGSLERRRPHESHAVVRRLRRIVSTPRVRDVRIRNRLRRGERGGRGVLWKRLHGWSKSGCEMS